MVTPSSRTPLKWRSLLVLGVGMALAVAATPWVKLNMSQSAPLGFYRLTAVDPPLMRETMVLVPVPAPLRAWQPWPHIPLLKPVAAIAGDEVCVDTRGLWIEGLWYGRVLEEAHGTPLPHLPEGCQQVPDGHVLLASPVPRSMDGRYFGFTPVTDLTAEAHPLLLWR